MNPLKNTIIRFLLFLLVHSCTSMDTITHDHPIKDGDVLVSGGQIYALGFFSPANSVRRYVGIWYHQVSERTVAWVANRDSPINDTSGLLTINGHGNLVLYQNNGTVPVWSTNVSVSSANNSAAQLLDTGNLVLLQQGNKRVLWESFDYPTHTLLPFMKLGLTRKTGLNRFLTSWKSPNDPGSGNYTYRINPSGFPQLYLYRGGVPFWRSGSWTGQRWSGVPDMTRNYIFNVSFVNNQDEISVMYGLTNMSIFSRMIVDGSGYMQRFTWNEATKRWIGFWSSPKESCDYYNPCGAYGNCNPYNADQFQCTCLPGYEPRSPQEWYLRDASGGCVRKPGVSTCGIGEGFVKVARVKAPDSGKARVDMSLDLKACEQECLKNCSCVAYASAYYESQGAIGCVTWYGDLLDTRTFTSAGEDLYVRVDAAELARYAKKGALSKKEMVAIVIVSIAVAMIILVCLHCLIRRKLRGRRRSLSKFSFDFTSSFDDSPSIKELDGSRRSSDLPCFDLYAIAASTNNFSIDNKLGQGGFGSVYKGVLQNGIEIAIKRLSKNSGQGTEEFKNEIALIAKLQHRNLVRILGCCIQDGEKMLIYEYLPNKSLDSFIFDETKRRLLDWNKRFEIICGIARGILYLHQDSRLRIIHRDLKASNVLLDATMNPKISDFGMARMFGGDQIEANTRRIVGTYGYMSPEYAMHGMFSIKSDVYSFGVLLLEVIAGKKNSGFYHDDTSSNLIGHVWDLWLEGKAMEMVDSGLLDETYPAHEILRCIQIGLLCVQEHAKDRPTMSAVVFMLSNDSTLAQPKQPAFIFKGCHDFTNPNTSSEGVKSVNEVTVTMIQPR